MFMRMCKLLLTAAVLAKANGTGDGVSLLQLRGEVLAEGASSGSCIAAQATKPCPGPISANCKGSFLFQQDHDITAFLTKDAGEPCAIIEGSLTIQARFLTATAFAKLLPLTAVCGTVTIQQLALPSLSGLDNLEFISGSFTLQQNPYAGLGPNLADISALTSLTYVGGALAVLQNYYLTEDDIDGAFSNTEVGGAVNVQYFAGNGGTTVAGSYSQCTGVGETPVPTLAPTDATPVPTDATPAPTDMDSTPAPTDTDGNCAAFDAKYPQLVKVDFATADVAVNNLGGLGPDTGVAQQLYYKNVALANHLGDYYDLVVTVIGDEYTPNKARRNGESGHYGQINLAMDAAVDLKFQFVDPTTGAPAALDKFFFSWFDIDQGSSGTSTESVILWPGYTEALVSTTSEIIRENVACPAGTCESFTSSTWGKGSDNPRDPLVLTEQQAARTFSVLYEDVSEFSVTLKTGPGKGGRNFIFTGMSEVAYADVEECCPDHVCSCQAVCMELQNQDWEDKCTLAKCSGCDECDTTTTTTTQPPATKEETCQDAVTFGVSTEQLVENTLGETAGGRLLFKNVAEHQGASLDLSVTDASGEARYNGEGFTTYQPDDREYTGAYRDAVRIAIDNDGNKKPRKYVFRFRFTDSQTGAAATLPLFPITLYDIDGKGETITACNAQAAITSEGSRLVETNSPPCYTHASTTKGKEVNLPDDFDSLNRNQKRQAVTYVYRNTGEWDLSVNLGRKTYNRYIIFKSSQVLACDYEDRTSDKDYGDKEKKDERPSDQ